MRTKEAVQLLGGTKAGLARALGISRQAIEGWGGTVPELRQYQIELILKKQKEAKAEQ